MITALYAAEKKGYALDEMVTASYDAVSTVAPGVRRAGNGAHPPYRLEFGGTHMGIKAGETLPLKVLMYGLMLTSGNDAANVIAQHVSGDVPRFMEELNRFVRAKGCRNTTLYTPHGLPHEEHKTTAFDMALLAREFIKVPFLREVAKATQYMRPETNRQPESMLHQHNALVKPGRFFYPKAIGIKTGYTVGAGYTLVAAAEDQNRKLVAVLLGCEKIEQRYKEAIAMFEAGFNEKKVSRTLFSKGFDLFSCELKGGKAPLQAYLPQDVSLEYYPSEEPSIKTALLWDTLSLPVAADQKVAQLQILSHEGKLLAVAPLFAAKRVEPTWRHQIATGWQALHAKGINPIAVLLAIAGVLVVLATYRYFHRPALKKGYGKGE